MTQPEGSIPASDHNKVCKLQRSIYGLKQASRSWSIRFNNTIKMFDFVRCEEEPYVYKKDNGSMVVFLLLYVNYIFFIRNDIYIYIYIYIYICMYVCMYISDLQCYVNNSP